MALPSTFKVEIEDASLVWQDVTASVSTLQDGSTSEAQIVESINIDFGIDADDVGQYLDTTLNPDRPRIRVTENDIVKYYRMERQPGRVQDDYDYPITGGNAFCGVINSFPLANYVNQTDIPMSALVKQLCVEDIAGQSGMSIAVSWLATQDPIVPGKRLEFNRARRLETIRDMAASCGAGVRTAPDGLGFEVYDIPSKALTGAANFEYDCPRSLSYGEQIIEKPVNAIRIKGSAVGYSIGTLPRLNVWVSPDSIPADGGESTATAAAQVFDATGVPVKHSFISQEPIDANSFTEIPVSGCFSVTGVWLNDGTQSVPVLGDRIDYTTFTASIITVPTQATDLFIVSYTSAESASWKVEDYADNVEGEAQNTTGTLEVETDNSIGSVIGVFLASDLRRKGANYYTGGSYTPNTSTITLGLSPGQSGSDVLCDYVKYNATPLTGVNVSPSTSLVNSEGIAESLVGSGSAIGTGMIVCESLGQQGFAQFSLTGDGVALLSLSANPAIIRKNVEDETITNTYANEVGTVTVSGGLTYVLVNNPVSFVSSVVVPGYPTAFPGRWQNSDTENRIYMSGPVIPNGAGALSTYNGTETISEDQKTSVIEATVFDSDGELVTDGTVVYFEFTNWNNLGCVLSSESESTVDGVAQITLTSGDDSGVVTVRAIVGGFKAAVEVTITDKDTTGGPFQIFGESGGWSWSDCSTYEEGSQERIDCEANEDIPREGADGFEKCRKESQDSNGDDGDVSGTRRVVGCEGEPLTNTAVSLTWNSQSVRTDGSGVFAFTGASEGSNEVVINGDSYTFTVEAKDSDGRGGYKIVCEDLDGNITYEGPVQ